MSQKFELTLADDVFDKLAWAAIEANRTKSDVLAIAFELYVAALKADEVVLTTNGVANKVIGLRAE